MKKEFVGPLSSFMKKYLEYRKSLGFTLKKTEYCLHNFDRFLRENFPDVKVITRSMFMDYVKTTSRLHSTTRKDVVCDLRQFLKYLFQFNTDTYIPEKALVPRGKVKLKPHIYSKRQAKQLMEAAKGLSPPGSLRPCTYFNIIGLLWVSGLRIREIVNLNNEDVDLDRELLHIKKTKFYKSRIIPISKSTAAALKLYQNRKSFFGYSMENTLPFFVNERKKRCVVTTIDAVFHNLVKHLNLKTAEGGFVRLHDFRHSFATRWLADIYQSGKDPNAYLPVLATYLGHANIANTQIYLHMSMDLLCRAGEKFRIYIHNDCGGYDE